MSEWPVGVAILAALLLTGMPIAFALALVGLVGTAAIIGWQPSLALIGQTFFENGRNYSLSVLPLFLMMGNFVVQSGIARDLYAAANACIVDISDHDERAKFFGYAGASLGLGFIFGPAIGGFLGEYWVRLPFIAAGALSLLVFVFGLVSFPETLKSEHRRTFSFLRANPLGSLVTIGRYPTVLIILFSLFCVQLANHSYSSIWSFYATAVAGWTPFWIGVSVSLYGLVFAGVQAGLTGPVVKSLGEVRSIYLSLAVGLATFTILAFAQTGAHIYFAIVFGGITALLTPSLQSLMTNRTPADSQGELQGAVTGLYSLSSIFAPPVMAWIFAEHTDATGIYLPGAPFLLACLLLAICAIGFSFAARRIRREPAPMDASAQVLAEGPRGAR